MRMKCELLIALGLGAALTIGLAAQAGEAKTDVQPWPESRSAESFEALLKKVFGGDPGGDGWGILDMTPSVSFPALTEAEIKRLFSGNTIYSQDRSSVLHFAADGTMDGFIESEKDLTGSWTIENGFVCMDLNTQKYKIGCSYAALVVDRVIFFKPNGKARFSGLIKEGRL